MGNGELLTSNPIPSSLNIYMEKDILWETIHDLLFKKYNPQTEMEKVQLGWLAEALYYDMADLRERNGAIQLRLA